MMFEGATFTTPGYPAITQITFLACCAQYPGGSNRCTCRFLPCPCCLPRLTGGSASTTSLSGPAQASLALRPARSQPAQGGLLSRGFDLAGYPTEPLGSYHVLPTTTWMDPPSTGDLRRWGVRRVEEGR